jgi:hypothetical protein
MPKVIQQAPPPKPALNGAGLPVPKQGSALSMTTEVETAYFRLLIYGRSGVGKTTLAVQAAARRGRLALLSFDPSQTGGARSALNVPNVTPYLISGRPVRRSNGTLEPWCGSAKLMAIADEMWQHFKAGQRPFETVVIDGLTSAGYIFLQEVLGVDPDDVPAILKYGKVGQDKYTERAEKIIMHFRRFTDMPCNVIIIAHERDHNPPKDEKNRVIGSKLMRDVINDYAPAQQGSWWGPDAGGASCLWSQNACEFTCQLYQDEMYNEYTPPGVQMADGQAMPGQNQMIPTGKYIRRLRMAYHPNYAARVQAPLGVVPDYIQAERPEDMWAGFESVLRGEKTKFGVYPEVAK